MIVRTKEKRMRTTLIIARIKANVDNNWKMAWKMIKAVSKTVKVMMAKTKPLLFFLRMLIPQKRIVAIDA
jgi:hypothetical protein